LITSGLELSRSVGLAFAVAASTLCPLLVLGIWWRGLTALGAACGMVVGGLLSGTAVTVAVAGGIDDDALGGWPAVMIGYPAAVSVPLAFATMIVVSLVTPATPDVAQIFARMHVPERLGMGIERVPRG
jgi:Na+(H+)/acetate symporter ActP